MDQAERGFRNELLDAVSECRKFGYSPTRFVAMLNTRTSFEVARSLLGSAVSEGFTTLWEKNRLDLSVEAIVLKPEWKAHFTEEELRIARHRLAEVRYRAPWDSEEPSAAEDNAIASLLSQLRNSSGDLSASKRIRKRLRELGHYGGLRQGEAAARRGQGNGSAPVPAGSAIVLPPVPQAEELLCRVRAAGPLPERNHEDVVKELLLRLGFEAAAIVFQTGRMDLCVLDEHRQTLAVFEVKRSIGSESERSAARRQGMDYAAQTGATFCVITDGDRYEIYDRRKGIDYEAMHCGGLRLTAFTEADAEFLDLLRPHHLRGGHR